jgi:2-polyprenyl-3-methyl-5-hydroxy-6-metoxy-1,4-benzoquinol methylase
MNKIGYYLTEYYKKLHSEKKKYGKSAGLEIVDVIQGNVGRGNMVLDLGCRDGSLTKHFLKGNEVIGVDIDDVALSICREDLGIKTFHHDLNETLPFDASSFDVVVASEVIEHLMFPEITLREVYRILKNEGVLVGSTPNITRIKNRLQFLFGNTPFFNDTAHLRYFSYTTLNELIGKYFSKVSVIPFGGHIIGSKKTGVLKFGIPVSLNTPLWIGKLFSSNLFFKAKK